jgi:hypothetical protein
MEENKLTQVTYPDYHISPGADKILVLSDSRQFPDIVDLVNKHWPQREVCLYLASVDMDISEYQTSGEETRAKILTWVHYQLAIVDQIWMTTRFGHHIWPLIAKHHEKISFFSNDSHMVQNFVFDFAFNENMKSQRFRSLEDLIAASIFKLT